MHRQALWCGQQCRLLWLVPRCSDRSPRCPLQGNVRTDAQRKGEHRYAQTHMHMTATGALSCWIIAGEAFVQTAPVLVAGTVLTVLRVQDTRTLRLTTHTKPSGDTQQTPNKHTTGLTCQHLSCQVPVIRQLHPSVNDHIVVAKARKVIAHHCTLAALRMRTAQTQHNKQKQNTQTSARHMCTLLAAAAEQRQLGYCRCVNTVSAAQLRGARR